MSDFRRGAAVGSDKTGHCRRRVVVCGFGMLGLVWGALVTQTAVGLEEDVLTVPTEVFRAGGTDGDAVRSSEPRPPLLPSLVYRLPPPTPTELSQVEGADDAVDEEGPGLPVRQVGIGRDVAQLAGGALEAPALLWQPTADGGRAAALAVASEGAKALRVRLVIEGAPPGLEVRVYDAAGTAATVVAVPAHQLSTAGEGSAELWTPTVRGDATTVELYLPAGTEPGELKVSIPVLSHLDYDLTSGIMTVHPALCRQHKDVACAPDEISDATRRAVAKYVYTTVSGRTGECTGTLLNDTDLATQIPYFLTAEHCLDDQQAASSIELYWFYERASCGGPDPESVTRQTGGGTVLARVSYWEPDTGVDHLLLRLNSDPPDGVAMAGWTTAGTAPGDTAIGVHHPLGAPKKLAWQSVGGFTGRFSSSGSSHIVTYPDVNLQSGSSGSGLWKRIDGADYLVGVASTSSQPSACAGVWNRYGRFDRFYPRVRRWLGAAADVVDNEHFRVTRLALVEAATRAEVTDLTAGDAVVDLDATAVRSFDIVAELSVDVGVVALTLAGPRSAAHASDLAPYSVFGPAGGGGLVAGSYRLEVVAYRHGQRATDGAPVLKTVVPFEVTGSAGDDRAVTGLALAVGSGPRIVELANGAAVTVYAGEPVEVRARTSGGGAVGSVAFALSGAGTLAATTNDAPFGVSATLTTGTYGITATPHAAADGGGEAGTALALSGVTVSVAPAPVRGFTLVDASGGLPDPDVGPLLDEDTVDLSAYDGWASVRAELASSTAATRVALALDGPRHVAKTVTGGVVSLFGESGGDYVAGAFPDGAYTLTAVPYVGPEPRDVLPAATVRFTVTGGFAGAVAGFTLIDARDDVPDPDFAAITDGAMLSLRDMADKRVGVRADLGWPEAAESVRLELRGPVAATGTDSEAPHVLFGGAGNDVQGGKLPDGAYTLTARPFSGPDETGDALPPKTVTFTIADSGWPKARVSGFTLIDAAGGPPDPAMGAVGQDASIHWPGGGAGEYSIRADLTDLDGIGSVRLKLSGPVRASRVENNDGSPFTLFGDDRDSGDVRGRGLPRGRYYIEATPFSGQDGSGDDGVPQTASFTLAPPGPEVALVTEFTLVDAGAAPPADVGGIAAGATLDASALTGATGDVRADIVFYGTDASSVVFELRGPRDATSTDSRRPFSLFGDGAGGSDYAGSALPNGAYTLIATPYPESGGRGKAFRETTVTFTVTGSFEAGTPAVTGFAMSDTGGGGLDLGTLADGATLDLTSTATGLIGLRAEPAVRRPDAKSVLLTLRGPKNVDRTVNAGTPWRLFGAGGGTLPNGTYTLTATPYTRAGGGGDPLPATTVTFTVTGSFEAGAAPVTGFTLVDAANGLPDPDLGPLADGAEVDLSDTGGLASVRAELAARRPDVEKVLLRLHGPRTLYRGAPARAPVSLFGDSGGDYVAGAFPAGDYTLTAYPAGPGDLRVHNFDDGAADGWTGRFRVIDGVFWMAAYRAHAYLADFEASDLVLEADVQAPPTGDRVGVAFGGTYSHRYLGLVHVGAGEAQLGRMTLYQGGGFRTDMLARAPLDSAGPWYRVKVVTEGARIELHVDGARVLAVEDPDYVGGRAGLWSWFPAAWDNVLAFRRDDPDGLLPETAVPFTVVSGAPSLSIAASEEATEGGAATFTITADPAPAADLPVAVSVTQGADDDYLPGTLPTSVTIAAGATEATLSVTLPDDDAVEPEGVVTATISESPQGYHVTTSSASLPVYDNDGVALSIAAGEAATEGGTATFTITANPAPAADLTVAVSVTQGADDDYLPDTLPTSVTIAAGATGATLSVTLPDDAVDEPDGVVTATIATGPGYSVAVASASVAVRDNDVPALSIAAGPAATEGGAATFTITANPAPAADLAVAVSVTQGADDDYLPDTLPTAVTIAAGATGTTLSVALPDDTADEPAGIIVATIGASPDYEVARSSASLAVHDNDVPALSIAAGPAATEGGAATFAITADPPPAADLAVAVSVTQGAGDDYLPETLPTSVTIAAGATEATLSVALPDDEADEADGVVTATIAASAGRYEVTVASASVTVRDDDVPALSIAAGEPVTEGDAATFTITADPAPAADLAVAVSVTQGAADDYLPDTLPTSVTLAAGATEATLSVALPDDEADEADGVVTATIAASAGRYEVTVASASVTVRDDDVPALSIAAGAAVTEGGTATFTITADPAPAAELAVAVSVTQGAEDDYLPDTLPTSVTIAAGATEATLSVALPDDDAMEPDGVVTATIAASAGHYEVTAASASVTVRDDDAPPLTAEFRGVPEQHWGKGFEFQFELLFSEFLVQTFSSATLREEALQATNATVTRTRRVVKKDNRHWTITARPDVAAAVTVTLPATTDCEATGALCTQDGRPLSSGVSATVAAAPPLTAEFVDLPESHDGRRPFEFELRFSEDFPGRLPYTLLRNEALKVENGTVRRAGRVEGGQNQRWTIEVRPDSHEAVTITLPAVTDCAAAGAVCTEAGRPLASTVSATVAGPPPLTAEFVDVPESHDGKSAFEFELRFSEDFPGRLPYTLLRDTAFEVTHGTVQRARRVAPQQNRRWAIEVQPDSHRDVTVVLRAATDCDAAGAVCTEAGRPLSNTVSATVAGSVEELVFLDGAGAERRVLPDRTAGFPIGAPVAASGPEPLEWTIADARDIFTVDAGTGQIRMAVDGGEVFELLEGGRFRYPRGDAGYYTVLVIHTTVTVADFFDRAIDTRVSIRVAADEQGDVALSTFAPKVGQPMSASVTDPDGVLPESVGWQWEYDDGNWVDDGGGFFVPVWRAVAGAGGKELTPTADMVGWELRAVARYADGLSAPGERDKRAESAVTDEVTLGNAGIAGIDLLQGPVTARFTRDGPAVQHAPLVASRPLVAVAAVHTDTGVRPHVVLQVRTADDTLDIEAALHSTVTAVESGTDDLADEGLRSLYVADVSGALVDADATFAVLVDPDGALEEADETDNELTASLAGMEVVQPPTFRIALFPVERTGAAVAFDAEDRAALLAETLALLPVGEHRLAPAVSLRVEEDTSPRRVLDRVHALWNRNADPDEYYHGVYLAASHAPEGLALVGGRAAISGVAADAAGDAGRLVAQGIAHNFGLASEAPPPAEATYGWSRASQRFFSSLDREIMAAGAGTAVFISHEHYQRAMRWMEPAAAPEGRGRDSAAGSLAITGGIDASGVWYLHSAERSAKPPRAASDGTHSAVIHDSAGLPMLRQPLRVLPLSAGAGGGWALRVPHTSPPPAVLRIRAEDSDLVLDAELDP